MICNQAITAPYPTRFSLSLDHAGANLSNSNWAVRPTSNYRKANRFGREMAAHFLQQLKDDPDNVGAGVLGHIAGDIDFQDKTATKGYWVGFFSYLERHLYRSAKRCDVFVDLAFVQAEYDHRAQYATELARMEG
ncbi:hypothetical protein MSP8886_01442 [Marinomonas spartinae]|uniref:Uncharacterized protein n=1 Tax=Marinomonas spartinae TaxID=1792290 RepID=A0A1A8TBD5_9GAMM|nr:hypothetical protein [Marinomonas spartinae]SBS29110.1 hypothetical protein MSP8886_01442 [Marinomonas spartinae]